MNLQEADPKGLIREAYRIDGIGLAECRTIFLDWAISVMGDTAPQLRLLIEVYGAEAPDHPMTGVLYGALDAAPAPQRRGGRRGRMNG
ncbi:hypothetical protein [Actibacterium sp. D379-3]